MVREANFTPFLTRLPRSQRTTFKFVCLLCVHSSLKGALLLCIKFYNALVSAVENVIKVSPHHVLLKMPQNLYIHLNQHVYYEVSMAFFIFGYIFSRFLLLPKIGDVTVLPSCTLSCDPCNPKQIQPTSFKKILLD